jgi:hypothetical protein
MTDVEDLGHKVSRQLMIAMESNAEMDKDEVEDRDRASTIISGLSDEHYHRAESVNKQFRDFIYGQLTAEDDLI